MWHIGAIRFDSPLRFRAETTLLNVWSRKTFRRMKNTFRIERENRHDRVTTLVLVFLISNQTTRINNNWLYLFSFFLLSNNGTAKRKRLLLVRNTLNYKKLSNICTENREDKLELEETEKCWETPKIWPRSAKSIAASVVVTKGREEKELSVKMTDFLKKQDFSTAINQKASKMQKKK